MALEKSMSFLKNRRVFLKTRARQTCNHAGAAARGGAHARTCGAHVDSRLALIRAAVFGPCAGSVGRRPRGRAWRGSGARGRPRTLRGRSRGRCLDVAWTFVWTLGGRCVDARWTVAWTIGGRWVDARWTLRGCSVDAAWMLWWTLRGRSVDTRKQESGEKFRRVRSVDELWTDCGRSNYHFS